MRIPDSQLYTGQDHPSSGMGGIIQIGWRICKWLIKPVMFYSFLRSKFFLTLSLLHVCCSFLICMHVRWRKWNSPVGLKPIVVLGGFPMVIFTRMILTCVHNSDLEKRDSVFDLSKNQKKKLPGFFLMRSKYSI